jgi:hypothetical protein
MVICTEKELNLVGNDKEFGFLSTGALLGFDREKRGKPSGLAAASNRT